MDKNPIVRKLTGLARPLGLVLSVGLLLALLPVSSQAAGVLEVEIVTAHNLIVDSNVTAPPTYAPRSGYIGAWIRNTGDAALENVTAYIGDYAGNTPGIFPTFDTSAQSAAWDAAHPHLVNTGDYSLTLETGGTGTADGTRYIGRLEPGEERIQYWLFSYPQCVNVNTDGTWEQQYPPCDVSIAGGVKPEDDLDLDYDVWADTTTAGVATASQTRDFTMRNEISASANKIWPNTTSKVPDEYLAAIQSVIGWGTLGPDGQPLDGGDPVYPGQRLITTQGIWYDLGNVVHGFDNDNNLIVDQNAWLQPVGDPGSFDAACFRMVNVYGIVIVKLKSGAEFLIPFENELYFENLPDNTGVVGLVYYQFIATDGVCTANMTPYQEAASGYDNEKFSADYGLSLGLESQSFGAALNISKSDGTASTSTGSTLSYSISTLNNTGVHLGAPEYGVPLVFQDSIPDGTTFVSGSADDSPTSNLVEASGTGSYTQGYTDKDGNLDECPLNYTVNSSSYVILYSTDDGASWSSTEPGSGVTDIRWMLISEVALDGGHDRTDCFAPDGVYDNGTEETSLPAGKAAGIQFQVTVDSDGGPVICNTVQLGFGFSDSEVQAQDCTLVTGPNSLSGTVFEDNGGTTGIYGNGTQDGNESGIGNATDGITIDLYYDLNGDGELDSGDILYGSTTADANGDYSFSSLPDGPFLVAAKKYDGDTSDGTDNAVIDFNTGWGNTTSDPNLSLLTDQGVVKMSEDYVRVILATNIDLDSSTGVAQNVTGVDFGFAPPLELTKTVAGNPDADDNGVADTPIDEGDVFSYAITLENRLPSVGVQGPTGCEYTVWSETGSTGTNPKDFSNPANAYDASSPNRSVASALVTGGGLRWMLFDDFDMAQRPGNITKVEGLFFGYFNTTLTDDYLDLEVHYPGETDVTATISTAQIESYVGEPADLSPNSAISWDISTLKPGGLGAVSDWASDFSDFALTDLYINPSKTASADQKTFYLDAAGLRVITDVDCVAGESTTLSPVPLQDVYDYTRFEFISAVPAPTAVTPSTGTIQWDDVGPILPGTSTTVIVTMRALDIDGTNTPACSGSPDGCNTAQTNYGGKNVYYADGRQANDDDDEIAVTIVGKGEIRGTAWNDTNNDGWPDNDGEAGLPNVEVTLYGCLNSDGVTLETGSAKKTCAELTGGNYWGEIATTTTDSNGDYEFLGLDSGYYIVEVGDTDGAPASGTGGNTSPYSGTQTAEPDDLQGITATNADGPTQSTYNNTWGDPGADILDKNSNLQFNFLNGATEETVNGVDFGYYIPTATIYGNVWHDVDGDAVADGGENGLSGFTVELYDDTDGDGDPDGAAVATVTTDANGNYVFSSLSADDYVVVVTPPTLLSQVWTETVESTGGTGSLNNQIPVTVVAGEFSGSHDFGYTLDSTASVGDTVFLDFDGDGILDSTEAGIPNITVYLYEDVDRDGTIDEGVDALIATDVTDANGNYLFEDLELGSYVVVVDTADTDFPTSTTATADPDTNAASIGDYIWLDADGDGNQDAGEEGIPGVVVILYEDTDASGTLNAGDQIVAATSTDINGSYLFTELNAGSYFVDVDESTLPGTGLALTSGDPVSTPTVITLADRTSSTSNLTADAGYSPSSGYAVGSRVWSDADGDGVQDAGEAGIGGVDITVTGTGCAPCTATTDESGYWLVDGLTNGATYSVVVDTNDVSSTFSITTAGGDTQSKTISSADDMSADFGFRYNTDGNVLTEDAGDPTGSITGDVFLDADGDEALDAGEAMSGVTVNLFDSDGNLVATTTTDATGTYTFTGVFIGTYSVQAVDKTATMYSTIFLAAGEVFSNLNVIYNAAAQTTADNQSSVSIGGVYADLNQDFGYQRFLGSIGDTVYHDVNENADQDFGEPGFGGVTVNLYVWADEVADGGDGDGEVDAGELTLLQTTTTTADDPLTAEDESGKYLFTNLDEPAADQYYLVRVDTTTLPGAGFTLIGDPDTDGVSCVDLGSPSYCDSQQTVTAYSAGINYLGADFGYQITGANYAFVGDYVWVDGNEDGVRDPGELGVSFVTVFFDADNDGTLDWVDGNGNGTWDSGEGERWTETDPDGYYLFTGLADGTYNNLTVLTGDPEWPAGLVTTPVYEVQSGNDDSLDGKINVVVSGGVVSSLVDGDADTTDTCTDCNLNADFGYNFAGNNILSGTICVDDATLNGYCGATATTYTGVDAGNETALSGITVSFLQWNDADGDNVAWAADGTLDPGDSVTFLGSTTTNTTGDYSRTNLPDDVLVLFSISEVAKLDLTTTNGTTSVEDGGVSSYQLLGDTTVYEGYTVTVLARQALDLSGDADNDIKDLDFAFDNTLGGLIAYDFGDLPDSGAVDYNATLLAIGGAQHLVTGSSIYLGTDPGDSVSTETDGKDSATASLDTFDDGVTLVSTNWIQGADGASVVVEATTNGWLAGWVDFNRDGDFSDEYENIIDQAVVTGDNTISFFVPATAVEGSNTYFARFRIYPEEPLLTASVGLALDSTFQPTTGEVEDYQWNLVVTTVTLTSFDARDEGGRVVLSWETSAENQTVGFLVERLDPATGQFRRLNHRPLPGLLLSPQGGEYQFADETAQPGESFTYRLVELESHGRMKFYGPFDVNVQPGGDKARTRVPPASYSRTPRKAPAASATMALAAKSLVAAKSAPSLPEGLRMGIVPFEPGQAAGTADKRRPTTDPASGIAKIFVEQTGLYHLDAATIAGYLGKTEKEIAKLISNGQLQLSSDGQEVAWHPLDEEEGIVFYGRGSSTIFTRYNVYWLQEGDGLKMAKTQNPGDFNDDNEVNLLDAVTCLSLLSGKDTPGDSLATRGDANDNGLIDPADCLFSLQTVALVRGDSPVLDGGLAFWEKVHREENQYEISSLVLDPEEDYYIWDVIFSGYPGFDTREFTLDTPGANTASQASSTLYVHLYSASNLSVPLDHHAQIFLNGEMVGDGRWDGALPKTVTCTFDSAILNDGENVVRVVGLLDSGATYSVFYVDSFDLEYPRLFQAYDGKLGIPEAGAGVVEVSHFTSPEIMTFDLEDPERPRVGTNLEVVNVAPGDYAVRFHSPNPGAPYQIWQQDRFLSPAAMVEEEVSNLKSAYQGVDYLIITPESLKDAILPLAEYRAAKGLAVKIVGLADIMDEFSFGVFHPQAIREFLAYTHQNWTSPPRYVVLIGKRTVDYKDYEGFGDNLMPPILVPTPYGLFSSDSQFVIFDEQSGYNAMAVGRLPVTSAEDLAVAMDKIFAYEQSGGGSWTDKVMILADNADEGGNFPVDSDNLSGLIPPPFVADKIYLSQYSTAAARQLVQDGINQGALLLNYVGHGGYNTLASEGLLTNADIPQLTNGARLPVMAALTCIVGRALPGFKPISEELMLHPQGGAIAVWSPTGYSVNEDAIKLNEEFFNALFHDGELTLGDAVTRALNDFRTRTKRPFMREIYNLLGDPALNLQ